MERRAFTAIELIVVLTVVVVGLVVVGLVLPLLGRPRGHARSMQNSTQVRGIHSGLVLFAQGNNTYYPGLGPEGGSGESVNGDSALTVENRMRLLIEDNYFTGEYIISPSETKPEYDGTGRLAKENNSYALLALTGEGERVKEWRETSNSESVVVADRAISTEHGLVSVHTRKAGEVDLWRGSVGFNDNHVEFRSTVVLPTKYGAATNEFDNLFEAAGNDDAAMAYHGTDDLIE